MGLGKIEKSAELLAASFKPVHHDTIKLIVAVLLQPFASVPVTV